MPEQMFLAAFVLYALAAFIYLSCAAGLWRRSVVVGRALAVAGCLLEVIGMAQRWRASGYVPLSNTYETMVFFSWCIVVISLFASRRYSLDVLGAAALPLAVLALGAASLFPPASRRAAPLVPALQSFWLPFHVTTCFIAYAAYAVSCGLGVIYLVKLRRPPGARRELERLARLNYRLQVFGVLLLALGIVSGALWANVAWGRYWGWDPKETWALICWLYYLLLLHLRSFYGWSEKSMAWLSVLGLFLIIFTFLGVNYLLPGLHAYV